MIRCEPGAVARSVETLVELVRACGFDSRSSSSPGDDSNLERLRKNAWGALIRSSCKPTTFGDAAEFVHPRGEAQIASLLGDRTGAWVRTASCRT
jgi:hypothetical protein